MSDFPRRNRIDRMTEAELAIRNAVDAVERAGADPRLTKAVTLLYEAREMVADFVDGIWGPMSEHDKNRMEKAVRALQATDRSQLAEAVLGLQSTDHPALLPLYEILQARYRAQFP